MNDFLVANFGAKLAPLQVQWQAPAGYLSIKRLRPLRPPPPEKKQPSRDHVGVVLAQVIGRVLTIALPACLQIFRCTQGTVF